MMVASSRGGRLFQGLALSSPARICSWCAAAQLNASSFAASSARSYSSSSLSAPTPTNSAAETAPPQYPPSRSPQASEYDIRSGLILTRAPLLTRRLHPFEEAFFFYQKRLEERLNTPFITDIYFKPDTARRLDWNLKVRERQGAVAKELGPYHGKGSRAWDDELRVGDSLSRQDSLMDSLLKDAAARVSDDAEVLAPEDVVPVDRPRERLTDADHRNDVQSLERKLDRTLYLVVKGDEGWGFPADSIAEGENLHQTAKRVLDQSAGLNMNTWIVGRVPVAHLVTRPRLNPDGSILEAGRKTFFLKARILAGQVDLAANPFGYSDFRWLTREELEHELAPDYFRGVRNMMPDR